VGLTVLATTGVASAAGIALPTGIFLGFLAALSSTAIVLKSYADRRELQSPQGSLVTGILLFQDFCLAPMIVLTPVLAGSAAASIGGVLGRMGLGVLLVGVAFALARLVMPRLLYWIVRTRVREVFLLGALGACLGMAMLTSRLGFSMALGAFLAGLVVSESEYGHQVSAEVLPFRDLFNSLFFVALGMLFRFETLQEHGLAVLAFGAGILLLKTVIAALVSGWMMYPARTAIIVGLSLAQVGEFSFVLARVGRAVGLLREDIHQVFLGASIFTMLITPVAIALAPRLAAPASRLSLPRPVGRLRRDLRGGLAPAAAARRGHVILVGYGLNGRNVSRVLRETAVPFVVLELNGSLVRQARNEGLPVVYGDATQAEILSVCGAETANLLVLAISDLVATRTAVHVARRLNPALYILVRTRALEEIDELLRLGANEVIPEEFETSIEIFCRVLQRYHVPRNVIDAQVRILRDETYGVLRGSTLQSHEALDRIAGILQSTLTDTFQVRRGTAADGRTLRDLQLRARTGAVVIAMVRDGVPKTTPSPDEPLQAQDTLVLVGPHAALEAAFDLLGAAVAVAEPAPDDTPESERTPGAAPT
jgi:CPA2 family monovalent cation:H+ antiporter-2